MKTRKKKYRYRELSESTKRKIWNNRNILLQNTKKSDSEKYQRLILKQQKLQWEHQKANSHWKMIQFSKDEMKQQHVNEIADNLKKNEEKQRHFEKFWDHLKTVEEDFETEKLSVVQKSASWKKRFTRKFSENWEKVLNQQRVKRIKKKKMWRHKIRLQTQELHTDKYEKI